MAFSNVLESTHRTLPRVDSNTVVSVILSQGGVPDIEVPFSQDGDVLSCDAVDMVAEGFSAGAASITVYTSESEDTQAVSLIIAPDPADGTLTNPKATNITAQSALLSVDTDVALGVLYFHTTTDPAEPTPEWLAANGTGVGVYAAGSQGPFVQGGLSEMTDYYFWFTQYIGGGQYSDVVGADVEGG